MRAVPRFQPLHPALVLLAWLLWLLPLGPLQAAGVQQLDRALVIEATPGQAPDWTRARRLQLPDDWAENPPGPSGQRWYRLNLQGPADADTTLWALYIERACSVLQLRLNGQLLHDGGRFAEPVTRHCHRPQLITVPAALLLPGDNQLELRVRGFARSEVTSRQRAGGLSAVEFGPQALMAGHHERRLLFAIRLPEVLSGTLLLMGGLMFVMGWFNRAQSYLSYFGALMVSWSLLLARLWAADLPVDTPVAEATLALLMSVATMAAVQFLLRYGGRRVRWINAALPLQVLVMAGSLALAGGQALAWPAGLWFGLLGAEVVFAALLYLHHARRQHSRQFLPMAVLLAVVGLAIVVQVLVIVLPLDSRVGYVAELVPPLAFIGMGLRLVQQFGRAFQTSEQSRAELEVRIREATAQIERNFTQLSELKVEQVTDRERKRIAADLHDDLGAKLLTIVHTSESERISTLAREALEEMRLSVRGLTGKPVKLADAFGDWRAEVMGRLSQSGIQGEWSAPPEEEVPQTLSSRAYVQTTRILREAVSNIIKHSGASQCSVSCAIAEGDFQLIIQDNGRGIPTELDGRLDKGHGMASMKGRAKQLQGQCLVESSPGYGTVIRLTLPLVQQLASG
ncbi:MAG: sensor histidine kinase [Burkholderiaceae bacterium]|nr:sensor histidine kinase [Burkholderiaceae bacterium]